MTVSSLLVTMARLEEQHGDVSAHLELYPDGSGAILTGGEKALESWANLEELAAIQEDVENRRFDAAATGSKYPSIKTRDIYNTSF